MQSQLIVARSNIHHQRGVDVLDSTPPLRIEPNARWSNRLCARQGRRDPGACSAASPAQRIAELSRARTILCGRANGQLNPLSGTPRRTGARTRSGYYAAALSKSSLPTRASRWRTRALERFNVRLRNECLKGRFSSALGQRGGRRGRGGAPPKAQAPGFGGRGSAALQTILHRRRIETYGSRIPDAPIPRQRYLARIKEESRET